MVVFWAVAARRCHVEEHQIQPIDMVVVNLYPFAQTVAREGCSLEDG
ncbi:hypothetical protein [Escherichia coli]